MPNFVQQFGILSIVLGACVAWFFWNLLKIVFREKPTSAEHWEFEKSRRIRLREKSLLYNWFEPLILELSEHTTSRDPDLIANLKREIETAPEFPPWKPEEYLASKQLESILAAAAGALFGWVMGPENFASLILALLCGGGAGLIYQRLMAGHVGNLSQRRIRQLKARLPFAVDLMAFMMESGASFQESMQTVVANNKNHPIAEELGEVIREISMGRPRNEALENLQYRLRDDDLSEMVFAINKGEEMGTPLSNILRTQADQMRLKRSQWMEKAAAEAQVSIVFPGMLIMVSCLFIVVAPFLLNAAF